jgi:hypothetical protein
MAYLPLMGFIVGAIEAGAHWGAPDILPSFSKGVP